MIKLDRILLLMLLMCFGNALASQTYSTTFENRLDDSIRFDLDKDKTDCHYSFNGQNPDPLASQYSQSFRVGSHSKHTAANKDSNNWAADCSGEDKKVFLNIYRIYYSGAQDYIGNIYLKRHHNSKGSKGWHSYAIINVNDKYKIKAYCGGSYEDCSKSTWSKRGQVILVTVEEKASETNFSH